MQAELYQAHEGAAEHGEMDTAAREKAWLAARYRDQQARIQASAEMRTEITRMLQTDTPDLAGALSMAIRCIGLATGDSVFVRQCEASVARHRA